MAFLHGSKVPSLAVNNIYFITDCDGSIKPNDSAIVTYIMPLFSHKTNLTIDITILLGGILYPFAASFLFPVS